MCIVICTLLLSRPARGAWVEIEIHRIAHLARQRRAPQGARGLKSLLSMPTETNYLSRPARGAWVEIMMPPVPSRYGKSRAPQGARGLKSVSEHRPDDSPGRAPQGARGLKFLGGFDGVLPDGRAPQGARGLKSVPRGHYGRRLRRAPQGARGLKSRPRQAYPAPSRRAPQGARGLKSHRSPYPPPPTRSRPARGAWVEIEYPNLYQRARKVAPRKGRVGCNLSVHGFSVVESSCRAPQGARGLKYCLALWSCCWYRSRPARGAWVEILIVRPSTPPASTSRPARGAWVEIQNAERMSAERCTSRPARGAWVEMRPVVALAVRDLRRAPQGARGLKSRLARDGLYVLFVAPRKGCVG